MSKPKTVRLRINADMAPMGMKGDVINVPVSRTGILKERYWRRRIKDAVHDNCVEILEDEAPEKKSKKTTKATPGANDGVNTDAE